MAGKPTDMIHYKCKYCGSTAIRSRMSGPPTPTTCRRNKDSKGNPKKHVFVKTY